MAKRTVISQLTSAGETALEQLTASPVTRKAVEGAMQVKERVEKLVGGLGDVDRRVAALEKRIEALEKSKRTTSRSTSPKKPAAKRPASTSKT